ncbi:MAG: Hsp20/alpha crystallin family protein [Promethearchaeota archaeon]
MEVVEIKKSKKGKDEKKEQKSKELAIRRESPFSLFQRMDRYFNDLTRGYFDDWYWPFSLKRTRPLSLGATEIEPLFRTPLTNITEDESSFNIEVEIPGLQKKDIEIIIQEGTLEIKGETKEEKKEEKEGVLIRREFRSSRYYRSFSLPENSDEDGIEANLDKGVLKIRIPKKEIERKEKKEIKIN